MARIGGIFWPRPRARDRAKAKPVGSQQWWPGKSVLVGRFWHRHRHRIARIRWDRIGSPSDRLGSDRVTLTD